MAEQEIKHQGRGQSVSRTAHAKVLEVREVHITDQQREQISNGLKYGTSSLSMKTSGNK